VKLSEQAKYRLYGVTAVACAAWLIQVIYQALGTSELWGWPNLILYVCLLLVITYTAYSAVTGWKKWKAANDTNDEAEEVPPVKENDISESGKIIIRRSNLVAKQPAAATNGIQQINDIQQITKTT